MTGTPQPLDRQFPIVDANGQPTEYFIRWAQQRQTDIADSITEQDLIDYLVAHVLHAGSGIQFNPASGNLSDNPTISTPLSLGFILNTGAIGVNVGPELLATRSGKFVNCRVVVKTSDPSADLVFKINKGGVNIFAVNPVVPAGSAPGTVLSFATNATTVANGDVFTIDITGGSAAWQATVILE